MAKGGLARKRRHDRRRRGHAIHGFKFGAVIGEAIAEVLASRRPAETAWAAGQC
jgi:hypothetical protein